MKISINKKTILIFLFILIIFFPILFFLFNKHKNPTISAFVPITNLDEFEYDLTGDSKKEIIKIISKGVNKDLEIILDNKSFTLSNLTNSPLSNSNSSWPMKVYIVKISRDSIPQILVQGNKDNKPINYLFGWNSKEFYLINENPSNLCGIIDSNLKRTPQLIFMDSSKVNTSTKAYMYLNNELLDISGRHTQIPNLDNLLSFINLIETDYELSDLPNIFDSKLPSSQLSLLWTLDKETYKYSFQNGFFYDEDFDNFNKLTSIKWTLSFEKYNKSKTKDSKEEFMISVYLTKTNEGFKISSFEEYTP